MRVYMAAVASVTALVLMGASGGGGGYDNPDAERVGIGVGLRGT